MSTPLEEIALLLEGMIKSNDPRVMDENVESAALVFVTRQGNIVRVHNLGPDENGNRFTLAGALLSAANGVISDED